jgi:hypothetical protein
MKLEANLELLDALSKTWPIAKLFVEFFQTMTTPDQFSRLLSNAVEKCRERILGARSDNAYVPKRSAPYKRPKLQQVILPQSRIVFQILARETQRRQTVLLQSRAPRFMPHEVEQMSLESVSGSNPESVDQESPGELEDTLESCDPSAVLANLREIIRVGNSQRADNST